MDKDGGLAVMLVTLGAALSSEVGALVVVIYAGLMVLVQTPRAWTDGAVRRRLAWWIVPVLASALVMLMIADNSRSGFPKLPTGDDALYHHPLASLQAALWRFPQEFVALDGETFDRLNFRRGAAVKLLFFLGMHCCWMTTNPEARRGRSRLLVLALALLIAMFGMVAGSYQEFGEPCCDRHGFVRQSLGLIAIAAVAIWLPLTVTALYRWRRFVASCALVGAAYILLHPRVYDMKADYRRYAEPARDRARTEQSAASSGLAMTMYLPYSDQLFPSQIPEGSYAASDNWWTPGILNYFHKQSVTIQFAPSRDAR
jgi:NADH:ubiquinone oxidoreductase subunit 6 (subunit J)